jgi:[ribosomal protein S18]-alanine N-acetyltransferase
LPYKIRFMSKDDLPQVSQIDKEAFPTQWPPTNYRSELQNSLARYLIVYKEGSNVVQEPMTEKKGLTGWFRQFFTNKPHIPKSKSTDLVVGFIGGWIMADELHITEIAVRESYRRQGIGHLMLVCMIEIGMMFKVRYATLEVRLSNETAQKLYEQFGFEKVGSRKAYYSDNKEDALIMTTGNIISPEYRRRISEFKNELLMGLMISSFPSTQELIDTKTVAP